MAAQLGSFAELANVKVGEVERPKPLPNGHYQAVITDMWKEHKARSGNLAIRFPCRLVAAGDDVDEDALAAFGGQEKVSEKEFNLDFWMSPDARFRFTDWGKAMGHDPNMSLLELAEALATSGEPFLIEAKSEPDQNDPEKIWTRFDNPAPAA